MSNPDYELTILYEVNILPRNKQEWVSGRMDVWIQKIISDHECFISVLLESASLNFDFKIVDFVNISLWT